MSALLSRWWQTLIYRCADQIAVRLWKEPTPEGAERGCGKHPVAEGHRPLYYWNASSELPKRLIGKVASFIPIYIASLLGSQQLRQAIHLLFSYAFGYISWVSSSATRRLYPWSHSDFRCDQLRPWYLLPMSFTEALTA
jgi:hypothetical protein